MFEQSAETASRLGDGRLYVFTCTALGEEASGDTAVEEEIMLDDDSDSGLYIDECAQDTIDTLDEEVDTSVDPDSLELNTNLPDNVVNILLIGVYTRDKEVTEGMQHADGADHPVHQ